MDITLRPLVPGDAPRITELADNARVAAFLRDRFPQPYRREDAEQFLAYLEENAGQTLARAICVDGQVAGMISAEQGCDIYRFNAEIGYWLGEGYWGKGVASQALGRFVTLVFGSDFMLKRLEAQVFEQHLGSIRVLEKNGFVREGRRLNAVYKHGRFHHELCFALENPNWPKAQ